MKRYAIAAAILAAPAAEAGSHGGSPDDDIHWIVTAEIAQPEEFDALVADMVASTEGEEGTIAYEWLRSGDTLHIYERYADSEAAMVHLGNFGAFADRFTTVLSVTGLHVYGPASDALREAAAGFGAVHYDKVGGFFR